MYEILQTLAGAQAGVVMRSQAIAAGYHADDIDHLLKRGEWVSLRRGAYVERDRLDAMDDVQKHRARIHAVMRSLRAPSVVSHVSAVVMHRLPDWGLDLDDVHVSRADLHSPRTEAGVHHHAGDQGRRCYTDRRASGDVPIQDDHRHGANRRVRTSGIRRGRSDGSRSGAEGIRPTPAQRDA